MLYGQTALSYQGDTLLCFTIEEARVIALTSIEKVECDTLLALSKQKTNLLEYTIDAKDDIIDELLTQKSGYKEIIDLQEDKLKIKDKQINKIQLKNGIIVGVLSAGLILSLIN